MAAEVGNVIQLAAVGIGGYGGKLLQQLEEARLPLRCRLVTAADTRLEAMPRPAEDLRSRGVRLYDDAIEMFEDQRGRCDAVYIASSIHTHAPLTIAAARCGYHVHLEKPPAATVQEVDDMLAALDRAGRICLVGFQALHGHMRLILDRIAAGRLGRVRQITCSAGWPRNQAYYQRNEWAGRLRCGERWVLDGPATNALAHQLAHMLAMASGRPGALATPTAVRAELYAAGPVESHNAAALEVRTAEGPVVRFYCTHANAEQFGPAIRVQAERGAAEYVHAAGSTVRYDDGAEEHRDNDGTEQAEMIANFLGALRAGRGDELRCSLAEARNYVLALDGAHESSAAVHRIAEEHWRTEGDTPRERHVVVDGLDEALVRAERLGTMLSDLPDAPPWAVATEPFDLAGYRSFPQRFRCDE